MSPTSRNAFSLLEVLLAMSILFGSLIVLGHLAMVGRQHIVAAEELTTAQLICRTRLNEIISGVTPARSVRQEPVEDAPGWACAVEIESLRQSGLVSVTVTVSEDVAEIEEDTRERPVRRFSLTRWLRSPSRQGEATSSAPPPAAEPPDATSHLLFDLIPQGESFAPDESILPGGLLP